MDIVSVIRRWALQDKLPIREISRRTGLSRNTIRRYLHAGIVETEQERFLAAADREDPEPERVQHHHGLVQSLEQAMPENTQTPAARAVRR